MKYLVKINEINFSLIEEFIESWLNIENEIVPACLVRNDYKDKETFINNLEIKEKNDKLVCSSVYFLYDDEINKVIGASDIRHELNDYLFNYGGHIGDGIHSLYRGRGNGKLLVKLTLIKCKEMELSNVLMVAKSKNIPSIKTIVANGGILENSVYEKGELLNRYWIRIK